MNFKRILKNIKATHNWEKELKNANVLFRLGEENLEDAIKRYGKILEVLLRALYKELSMNIPPKRKSELVLAEKKVGRGRPIIKFGLGQMIGIFREAKLFNDVNKGLNSKILDPVVLDEINAFRIDQTHYDEDILKSKVNEFRESTTHLLLELRLITGDPDEEIEIAKKRIADEAKREARLKRINKLQHLLERIRLGLIKNAVVQGHQILDNTEGWYADIEVEGEILGACIEKGETLSVIVRVTKAFAPVDEEEKAYETLASEVRTRIEGITPETKQKMRILFFDETDGSGLASVYASWTTDEGIVFQ